MKKKEEFQKAIQNLVSKLESHRQEYYDLFIDNDKFVGRCVPAFRELAEQIEELNIQISERKNYISDFEVWKAEGDAIDADFKVLNY